MSIFVWVISAIYVNTPQKLVRKRSQPTCVCSELHCDELKQRFLTAEPVSAMSESITTQKPCIHFTRPSRISTRHSMHTPAVFIFAGKLLYNWPVNMHSKNMFVVPADPFLFFTNILKPKQWSWIFWCIHYNIFWQDYKELTESAGNQVHTCVWREKLEKFVCLIQRLLQYIFYAVDTINLYRCRQVFL